MLYFTKKADALPVTQFKLDFSQPCLVDGELNSPPASGYLKNYPGETQLSGCTLDRMSNRTNDHRYIRLPAFNISESALQNNSGATKVLESIPFIDKIVSQAQKAQLTNFGYYRHILEMAPMCENNFTRADIISHLEAFYNNAETPFSAVNGPGVVIAFVVQLGLNTICLMILIHYLYISCGCARIPQNFKPANPFINPNLFNCTRVIAVFKVIALAPFMLLMMLVISFLMGLYLELYTKPLLLQHSSNMKAVVSMSGCFDPLVNSDITHLSSVYSSYNNQFDESNTLFTLNITQYVLAGLCFLNLSFSLYFMCQHKALVLMGSFCLLDDIMPAIKIERPKGVFDEELMDKQVGF